MSIAEVKKVFEGLSPSERHELMCWLETEHADDGDISDEALVQNAAEMFQTLDCEEAPQRKNAQGSSR